MFIIKNLIENKKKKTNFYPRGILLALKLCLFFNLFFYAFYNCLIFISRSKSNILTYMQKYAKIWFKNFYYFYIINS